MHHTLLAIRRKTHEKYIVESRVYVQQSNRLHFLTASQTAVRLCCFVAFSLKPGVGWLVFIRFISRVISVLIQSFINVLNMQQQGTAGKTNYFK